MPYRIEWNNERSLISFSGKVSFQEMREVGEAHYGDERLDTLKYLIADFSNADLSQVFLDQVSTLASLDSISVSHNPNIKMAFVIADEPQRQICESYIEYSKTFQSSWSYEIFTNFEEAQTWCVQ